VQPNAAGSDSQVCFGSMRKALFGTRHDSQYGVPQGQPLQPRNLVLRRAGCVRAQRRRTTVSAIPDVARKLCQLNSIARCCRRESNSNPGAATPSALARAFQTSSPATANPYVLRTLARQRDHRHIMHKGGTDTELQPLVPATKQWNSRLLQQSPVGHNQSFRMDLSVRPVKQLTFHSLTSS
jgi:hypothetical protein